MPTILKHSDSQEVVQIQNMDRESFARLREASYRAPVGSVIYCDANGGKLAIIGNVLKFVYLEDDDADDAYDTGDFPTSQLFQINSKTPIEYLNTEMVVKAKGK